MENNIFKKIGMLWICISIVFILPMNISLIFAESGSSNAILDSVTTKSATNEKVSSVCGGGFNIKDSLLMSVVTICIPGILEKVNEWKNIKCETTVCYYDAVRNNLDPTFCMKQESYRTCKYIVGDIFSLPGINMIDYLREKLSNALANPGALALSVIRKGASKIVDSSCNSASGCTFATNPIYWGSSVFLVVVDGMSLAQQIKDIFQNGFFPDLKSKSSCDRLPAIKSEMDKIIKYS